MIMFEKVKCMASNKENFKETGKDIGNAFKNFGKAVGTTMKVAFHTFNMYKGTMVVDCRGYRYRALAGIINLFRRPFVKG